MPAAQRCDACGESLDHVQPANGEPMKECYWCGFSFEENDRKKAAYAAAVQALAGAAAEKARGQPDAKGKGLVP